jgi:hypothetical protein
MDDCQFNYITNMFFKKKKKNYVPNKSMDYIFGNCELKPQLEISKASIAILYSCPWQRDDISTFRWCFNDVWVLWGWMMRMHDDEKNKKNDMKSANQVGMSVAFHEWDVLSTMTSNQIHWQCYKVTHSHFKKEKEERKSIATCSHPTSKLFILYIKAIIIIQLSRLISMIYFVLGLWEVFQMLTIHLSYLIIHMMFLTKDKLFHYSCGYGLSHVKLA